jgi:hypothetical protein
MRISPQGHRGHKVDREWTRIDANENDDPVESNSIRVNSCAFVVNFVSSVSFVSLPEFLT